MNNTAAVILAAGQGTRMKSALPKVLHAVAGRPLIHFPTALALGLGCDPTIVVVGHGREQVQAAACSVKGGDGLTFVVQAEQLGTGHAVASALPALKKHQGAILILSGDVPLLGKPNLRKLERAYARSGGPIAFLTFCPADPTGYGRVVRQDGKAVAIKEDRDCSRAEKAISEVNAGIYLIDAGFLRQAVKNLKTDNDQGEFYLTDLIKTAAVKGAVATVEIAPEIGVGVNDRVDLARIEAMVHQQIVQKLMRAGVTIRKPETVCIDSDVTVGSDSEIEAGAHLTGKTKIGRGCRIETGAVIRDAVIADGAVIKAYSVIESAKVGQGAEIGPMGRLRPGADVRERAKVGNFVELKNTILGPDSKANHLAYLGDGVIGTGVNVGAGTIFCNYDGYQKHRTVLENDVFIGSDSQLVAPVVVGCGAYVASGTTITKDVPADALAVGRARQVNKEGVAPVLKRRFQALKEKARKLKK
ncbi:MAG: bifunctional UDP-N-acetylglucosamine diphosphorylase/glucosamine-1-phosphate N-acetyltransferase GlmU [Myxococcota bacterium]|nr:bifunctional UDP-N-acetylglucosamine diphosphorylase/glucosamine-1-phosphate N-acetyltransferase GlmU [Myxococcota bacterium]